MSPSDGKPSKVPLRDLLRGIVEGSPDADRFGIPPGFRPLNLDAHSGQVLFSYAPGAIVDSDEVLASASSMTFSELAEREQRLERQSIDLELREGKSSARNLCRECRRHNLIKRGNLSDEGNIASGLFGGWAELICRQQCSVHRLIIRFVAIGRGALHPRLSSIDHEVQGT
jgi:hypothetical protein